MCWPQTVTPTSLGSSGGGSVMSALFRGKRKVDLGDGGVCEWLRWRVWLVRVECDW